MRSTCRRCPPTPGGCSARPSPDGGQENPRGTAVREDPGSSASAPRLRRTGHVDRLAPSVGPRRRPAGRSPTDMLRTVRQIRRPERFVAGFRSGRAAGVRQHTVRPLDAPACPERQKRDRRCRVPCNAAPVRDCWHATVVVSAVLCAATRSYPEDFRPDGATIKTSTTGRCPLSGGQAQEPGRRRSIVIGMEPNSSL
jgi:hypothetical protein